MSSPTPKLRLNPIHLWIIPLILFFYLYFPTFINIYQSWFTFWGSHGPLILGISLYLVWINRKETFALPRNPSLLLGGGFLLLGCLVLIAGRLSFTKLIEGISLVITLFGLIGLMGGRKYMRALLVPVIFLVFLFPLFDELLGNISILFQQITARIAAEVLALSGISVLLTDKVIQMPHITLEVAKSCNGINHIIALVALAVPLAYLNLNGRVKKIFLVVFAFFLGIFLNGLRVAAIGLWTKYSGGGEVHGPHDIFYVSIIFFLGMGILILASRLLSKSPSPRQSPARPENPKSTPLSPVGATGGSPSTSLPVAIGLLLLCITTGYLVFFKPLYIPLNQPLTSFPHQIGNWQGQENSPEDSLLKEVNTKDRLDRAYQDSNGEKISLSIRYLPIQGPDQKIVGYKTDGLHDESGVVSIPAGNREVAINSSRIKNGRNNSTVYFWYAINGKILVNRYKAKMESLLEAAFKRKTNGAIVVVSIPGDSKTNETTLDFLREVIPLTESYLHST